PRHRFGGHFVSNHLSTVEDGVGPHVGRHRREHLLLAIYETAGIERCYFKSMTVCDGVRRAGFYTVPTEYAPIVVDVINLGVAFGAAHPVRFGIFCSLDIDTIGGTSRGAQKTGNTLFQAIFVALQNVHTPVAFLKPRSLKRSRTVGVVLNQGRLKHLPKGD